MDFAPWASSPYSFAGWVPNVGSHLSFSLIGSGLGPGVTRFTQNFDGRSARMVCALQRRETDDFLSWKLVSRLVWPDVVQHWLLIGSTVPVETHVGLRSDGPEVGRVRTSVDVQGALTGTIHMLPRHKGSQARQIAEWMLEESRRLMKPDRTLSDKELDELAAELRRSALWRWPGAVRIEFALMRTGELRLWYADDTLRMDIRRDRLRILARQAYFFVKDMVHNHTHHEPSSDQITPLVAVGTASPARMRAGEESWRRETVWHLSRAVDVLVRAGKLLDLRQALGILAYADAFQKTLLPYLRKGDAPALFEPNDTVYAYDFAHMKESIRVLIEQGQAKRTHNTSMLIAALASSIAALSLLSSLVSTHNSRIDPPAKGEPRVGLLELNIHRTSLEWLAHEPIAAVICICVGVLLISLVVSDGGARLLRRSPRKLAQAVRGASLSVGRRLRLGARPTHYLLVLVYAALIFSLTFAAVRAPLLIHRIVNGRAQMSD